MSRADEAHRRAQVQLRQTVGTRLGSVISSLPRPQEQDAMELYSKLAVPIVAGAQRRSATLAFGYMREVAGLRGASIERAMRDVRVTAESAVARSPILRLWAVLAQPEATLAQAQAEASSYAYGLSSGDLQMAERAGLSESARASGEAIVGWRKDLDGDACEWCVEVGEDQVYSDPDSVPFHDRDACGVAPVLRGEE